MSLTASNTTAAHAEAAPGPSVPSVPDTSTPVSGPGTRRRRVRTPDEQYQTALARARRENVLPIRVGTGCYITASSSHAGQCYKQYVDKDKQVTCTCEAGEWGSLCKHKAKVLELERQPGERPTSPYVDVQAEAAVRPPTVSEELADFARQAYHHLDTHRRTGARATIEAPHHPIARVDLANALARGLDTLTHELLVPLAGVASPTKRSAEPLVQAIAALGLAQARVTALSV